MYCGASWSEEYLIFFFHFCSLSIFLPDLCALFVRYAWPHTLSTRIRLVWLMVIVVFFFFILIILNRRLSENDSSLFWCIKWKLFMEEQLNEWKKYVHVKIKPKKLFPRKCRTTFFPLNDFFVWFYHTFDFKFYIPCFSP